MNNMHLFEVNNVVQCQKYEHHQNQIYDHNMKKKTCPKLGVSFNSFTMSRILV